MTHRLERECNHECADCFKADPDLCHDYALMTADNPDLVRFCKHCNERAWHQVTVFTDGAGSQHRADVWACPRCQRVFG